jgi:uncharacterized membrane protein YraQ (UPF0718 family)
VLPAAASIKKQGANNGATTAFLISTPESGVDSIAITYALLDPVLTVVRPLTAFLSAMAAGFAENLLFWKGSTSRMSVDLSCPIDGCCDGIDCPAEEHARHHSFREKLVSGLRFGLKEVWGDIVGWFFVGVFLAALITTLVPDDLMVRLLGGGLTSMLVMLIVGIPMYICATASTPVAAALILKGVSPGAALVFLLVGPATNVTSLSVVTSILGKRSTLLYLAILSCCAVAAGLLLDYAYQLLGLHPRAMIGEAAALIPNWIKLISVLVLLVFSVQPLYRITKKKFGPKKKQEVFFSSFPTMPGQPNVPQGASKPSADNGNCGCAK